jgi:hypothetical protein
MSTQPTVADLAHKAMQINDLLNNETARSFIRMHNIRSNSKLETLLAEHLTGKTAEEIAEICKAPEGAPRKPNAKVAEVAKEKPAPKQKPAAKNTDGKKPAEKKFERKGKEPREVKIVTEGTRGFRFGEVWCNSVRNAEGVAMLESNRPKLIKHAQTLGVAASVIESNDPVKIAKSLTLKLDKQEAAESAQA